MFILRSLFCEMSITSLKGSSSEIALQCFLFQIPVSSLFRKVILQLLILLPRLLFPLNNKKFFSTSKFPFNLRNRLVKCYVRGINLVGSETSTLEKVQHNYLENLEIKSWRRMEKISQTSCVKKLRTVGQNQEGKEHHTHNEPQELGQSHLAKELPSKTLH